MAAEFGGYARAVDGDTRVKQTRRAVGVKANAK
jgi:hypothetical protein